MAGISLLDVTKTYPNGVRALNGVSHLMCVTASSW